MTLASLASLASLAVSEIAAPRWKRWKRWKLVVWRHPEWWTLVLSAAAWLTILVTAVSRGGHPGQAMHLHGGSPSFGVLSDWLLMVASMMFPMLVGQVQFVAARSCWPRRNRAIALLLAGYTAVWLSYGVGVELALDLLGRGVWIVMASVLLAVAWQFTPAKQSGLVQCHRTTPLAPSGWRADRDCMRYGWTIGGYCCLSCCALMLVCAAAGHSLGVNVVVTGVVWTERRWLEHVRALMLRIPGRKIQFAR